MIGLKTGLGAPPENQFLQTLVPFQSHIAWLKGPHLGFLSRCTWTAHVGVDNFAPGAPHIAIHRRPHNGPRDVICLLMGTMWAPSKFSEHTWAPHGPLIIFHGQHLGKIKIPYDDVGAQHGPPAHSLNFHMGTTCDPSRSPIKIWAPLGLLNKIRSNHTVPHRIQP